MLQSSVAAGVRATVCASIPVGVDAQSSSPGRARSLLVAALCCAGLVLAMRDAHAGEGDIVLGQIASTSNPSVADSGRELQRGYQLYFDKINAKGGIHGRKIRLVEKDDGYDAQKTVALTRELIEKDNVLALVGYLGTPGSAAVGKEGVLTANDVALIAPANGTTMVLSMPNMFPVRATYEDEIAEIARHARSMGLKKVAMLTWTAGAGPVLAKAWPAMIAREGLELSAQQTFDTSTDGATLKHNIYATMPALAAAQPQAVFLIASGNAVYTAVESLRATLPPQTTIYTVSAVNWKELITRVGPKKAAGVIVSQCVPYPYSPMAAVVKEYLEDIRAASKGDTPSYYGLEGYLGAVVAVVALRNAAPPLTRHAVVDALQHMGHIDFGGFDIDYSNARRRGFAKPDITMITSQGTLLR